MLLWLSKRFPSFASFIRHEIPTFSPTQYFLIYSRSLRDILRFSSMRSMSGLQRSFVLLLTVSLLQQECVLNSAAQTGGSTDDLNFTCKSPAFLSSVHACEAKACSPSDISRMPHHCYACIEQRSGYILMLICRPFPAHNSALRAPWGNQCHQPCKPFKLRCGSPDRPVPVSSTHSKQQPGLDIATVESGCSITDWTCICTSSAYTVVTDEFEKQYCSPADRQGIFAGLN